MAIYLISYILSKLLLKIISDKITFQNGNDVISNNYLLAIALAIISMFFVILVESYFSADIGTVASSSIIALFLSIIYGILFLVYDRKSKDYLMALLVVIFFFLISGAIVLLSI
ncbi:hypothetical protein [Sutcliffiella deserti]|uniref:hypothetical protein n=1 Tax=Sutcliffiella deserti TaxID=2875501 RepID=UPI001CBB8763|nr:hypothetical protein [Sutcliffiella deserti]